MRRLVPLAFLEGHEMKTTAKVIYFVTAIVSTMSWGFVHAQGQDVKQIVATKCSACHGMDGNSASPKYPNLAGQQKEYFVAQVKAFRNKTRMDPDAHTDMWAVGATLDDAMAMKLAEYFASQKPAPGKAGDPQLAAKGKVIYERGIASKNVPACVFCHGQNGQGISMFPRLAGQHGEYLIKQIKVFHTDNRPNLAKMMKSVVAHLSDEEAAQVAAYLQGL
jgi:cytochrome c553